jgi:POT family proton-dependent oligopeptide transporter
VFYLGKRSLKEKGLPPNIDLLNKPLFNFIKTEWAIYGSVLLLIPVIVFLFHTYELMDYIMFGLGGAAIVYVFYISFKLDITARKKLFAALTMIIFSAAFWAFYEQNSGSLNLFAIRNVDMNVMGYDLPALSVNNFLPPGWVIVLTFLFAWLWPWLNKKGKEPSTPMKFSFAFILMGIGFYVFYIACKTSTGSGLIPLWTFVFGYLFIISGELCLSPIGLSMVTKLSPVKVASMMMGIWFFANAIGDFLASKIGSLMSVPAALQNNAVASLPYYADIINKVAWGSIGAGLIIMITTPLLRKWMKDIH